MSKKLAFGCGNINYHELGYNNVDVRKFPHVDHVADISKKLPWKDEEIDEILAESVLEHIPHGLMNTTSSYSRAHLKTIDVLKEWCRVLVVGGRCIVKVPNIRGLINNYIAKNIPDRDFYMYLYGGQNYPENTHTSGFTPETLVEVMQLAGFRDVVLRNAHNYDEPLDMEHSWEMAAIGIK